MGGLELHRVFKFKSSRLGTPSVLVKRSLKLISGYILVGSPEGRGLISSVSFLSKGFEFNSLIISESFVWVRVGESILDGVLESITSEEMDC